MAAQKTRVETKDKSAEGDTEIIANKKDISDENGDGDCPIVHGTLKLGMASTSKVSGDDVDNTSDTVDNTSNSVYNTSTVYTTSDVYFVIRCTIPPVRRSRLVNSLGNKGIL